MTKEKKSAKDVIFNILSGIKKHWYIYVGVLTVLIVFCFIVSILNRQKENEVKRYINGKTFVFFDLYGDYEAYSFNNGKMSYEAGYKQNSKTDGSLKGNINDYIYYFDISASVFSKKIWISDKEKYSLPGSVAVYLDNDIVKKYKHTDSTPEWREVTLEELENLRRDCICKHEYSNWTIVIDATKDTKGQKERVCTKCKKTELLEFDNPWLHQPSIQEYYDKLKTTYGNKLSDLKVSDWGDGKMGQTILKYEDLGQEIKIEMYSNGIYNGVYGVSTVGVKYGNYYHHDKTIGEILERLVYPFVLYYQYQPDYTSQQQIIEWFENDVEIKDYEAYGEKYHRIFSGTEFIKNDTKYDFSKAYNSWNGGTKTRDYVYYLEMEPLETNGN